MKLANSLLAIRFWIIEDAKMLKRNAILETFALNKTLFFKDLAISDRSMIPRFPFPHLPLLFHSSLSPFDRRFQSLSYESFFLYIYDSLPLRSKFQSLLFFKSTYLVFPSFIFLFFFFLSFLRSKRVRNCFNSFNNSSNSSKRNEETVVLGDKLGKLIGKTS